MSQFSYTKKPDWNSDGAKARSLAGTELFASPTGAQYPATVSFTSPTTSLTTAN